MKKILILLALIAISVPAFGQELINCAPNQPCTSAGPQNTNTGDTPFEISYKVNDDMKDIYSMFGAVGLLKGNGAIPNALTKATSSDVIDLWTNCSAADPVLGYQGACIAGGSGGGTPAGSSYSLQYNNAGAFGGVLPGTAGVYCIDWTALTSAPTFATCAQIGTAQTWTALQTFTNSDIALLGSSTGYTTITSANTSATNYTITIPAVTATLLYSGGPLGAPSSGDGSNITGVDAASVGGFTLPCTVPTLVSGDYLTNNGTTCNWAAISASGITLQTGGTNNASQTTLNLVGTGNVSVTNPTGGTVDIGPLTEPIGNSGSQITTLPYTVTTSDCGSQLVVNDASAGALDVPEANGSFATCQFDVTNLGAGTVTITPTTSTVNGSSTLAVAQNAQCTLNSDGTNWQVIGCTALSSSGSGQPQDIQDFTTPGTNTWTKPSWASSDSTATTRVACVGGGGGGASGAVEASGTAALGGGAGGGAAFAAATFKTSALASTETVTVGAGGTGGAALTSTGSGKSGNNGSDSSFGSLLVAYAGAGGLPGNYGGGGGGVAGAATTHQGGSVCGGTGTTTSGNAAGCADGGGGGAGGSNTGNAGYTGGNSGFGGAGGGSGGGLASTPATTSGGNGGNANSATGGTGGSAATTGSVGVSVSGAYIGGSGGGGGGSATSGTAGSGGNGVNGSGGGGGGGAEVTSGAGGTGGNGLCRVVTTY